MRKFIAFHNNMSSSIHSKEKCMQWATDLIVSGKASKIHICEVIETVERTAPPIECKPFFVQLEGEEAKAA